jgi:hypothetical protein
MSLPWDDLLFTPLEDDHVPRPPDPISTYDTEEPFPVMPLALSFEDPMPPKEADSPPLLSPITDAGAASIMDAYASRLTVQDPPISDAWRAPDPPVVDGWQSENVPVPIEEDAPTVESPHTDSVPVIVPHEACPALSAEAYAEASTLTGDAALAFFDAQVDGLGIEVHPDVDAAAVMLAKLGHIPGVLEGGLSSATLFGLLDSITDPANADKTDTYTSQLFVMLLTMGPRVMDGAYTPHRVGDTLPMLQPMPLMASALGILTAAIVNDLLTYLYPNKSTPSDPRYNTVRTQRVACGGWIRTCPRIKQRQPSIHTGRDRHCRCGLRVHDRLRSRRHCVLQRV